MQEPLLYQCRASIFRSNPILFFICLILVPALGIGALFLFVWWWRAGNPTLTVTVDRIILKRGIFSQSMVTVYHNSVQTVRIGQKDIQKLFNAGDVGVTCSSHADKEIRVSGILTPEHVGNLINHYRKCSASNARGEEVKKDLVQMLTDLMNVAHQMKELASDMEERAEAVQELQYNIEEFLMQNEIELPDADIG